MSEDINFELRNGILTERTRKLMKLFQIKKDMKEVEGLIKELEEFIDEGKV